MTAVLVGRFEPGSPEWHAARAQGIGGSEIAAVMGLSPFESRFSLWHRKAGAIGPVEETPEMEWGKRLEPAVIRKFLDEHPELTAATYSGTWHHADRPWQIANPDQLLEPGALLEVKTSPWGEDWGDAGTDEVPIHVRVQVLWYLDTLGLTVGHIAVLIGGCDYREYVIRWSEPEAATLRRAAREFLDDLANGVRPDVDAHTATYQTIRETHPDINPDEIVLPNDLAARFCAGKAVLAEAESRYQLARSQVADRMGNARRAIWDGQTIATRQARKAGLPYLVAARNLPWIDQEVSA